MEQIQVTENSSVNEYLADIPLPACILAPDGCIKAANALMKDVFAYEGIAEQNFFALTGVKRKALVAAARDEEAEEIKSNEILSPLSFGRITTRRMMKIFSCTLSM